MKESKSILIYGLFVTLFISSCATNDKIENNNQNSDIPQKVIDAATKLNFNTSTIRYEFIRTVNNKLEKKIVIENDIMTTENQLIELTHLKNNRTDQYYTNNLVTQGKIIKITGYNGGRSSFKLSEKGLKALKNAVAKFNDLNLSLTFIFEETKLWGAGDIFVYDMSRFNSSKGGRAGFPYKGKPYNEIQIFNLDQHTQIENQHVLMHEISHSIGMRHTDWFGRNSCKGDFEDEGDAGVGINHIDGTPNESYYDNTSIMLACPFNEEMTGEFNNNDVKSLKTLYPKE
ncbi:M57 family metalloprotease [Tenacibaculum sp. C7A-26P2]|uniref:M57 family metalloprotease n=1 Tax=Tenacibaculum sp. C7A-26P2 TaxID=3447504 RepID=UPI003F8539C3